MKVKSLENKADPKLIKNPFICNSQAQIRLSLDKDPRVFKGGTLYTHKVELENGNTLLHNPQDERLSFMIGKGEFDYNQSLTDMSKYDYQVPVEVINKTSKVEHTQALPISFLQIRTEEEGIDWYARHFPKIPTDLLPIIARYHWGEPITKKGIKNEKKKIEKKLKKEGLSVEQKKVVLSFD